MKFISHLDMNRFMSRLIVKSKIPIWYTEGFNQHIYMSFAVPLSLGFEGLYEVMDIRLTDDDYSLEACIEALNSVSVPDVEFIKAAEPIKQSKDIGFAEFKLCFEAITDSEKQALTEFLHRDSVICQKIGKHKKVKEIDIIPKIKDFSLKDNTLTLCLAAGSEDNLNPSLVMSAFFDKTSTEPIFYSVTRTLILDKDGKPFE